MSNENSQDGSARVRHVPIQVESRANTRHSSQGRTGETGASQRTHHNTSQHSHYAQNQRESPDNNTSSININFKPTPPSRQSPQQQHYHQNHQQQHYQQNYGSPGHNKNTPSNQEQHLQTPRAHDNQTDKPRSRVNSCSKTQSSDNSDKLVGSPEPIPLPPPKQSADLNREAARSPPNSDTSLKNDSSPEIEAKQQQQQQVRNQKHSNETSPTLNAINAIKLDVGELLKEIVAFTGLDNIECGESVELRQQRKAVIKMVDLATDILQRKQQINADIQDLSESMTTY